MPVIGAAATVLLIGGRPYSWLLLLATLSKFTHGLCLRRYLSALQPVWPALGRSSEKPVKVSLAATS